MSKLNSSEQAIADKIMGILELFPKVSPSMLQISLGSGIPVDVWKPVLEKLITSGDLYRYNITALKPSGRMQSVAVISTSPDDGTMGVQSEE